MDVWEQEFEWLRVRHLVQNSLKRAELPDMNAILFLIGIQELGRVQKTYSKEEKQDLMHIAICRLMSYDGGYEFVGRDADGWPHWKQVLKTDVKGVREQEQYLQQKVIQYFKDLEQENGGLDHE